MGRSTGEKGSLGPQSAVWGMWEHSSQEGGRGTHCQSMPPETGKGRLNPGTAGNSQALLGSQCLIPFTKGFFNSLKKQIVFWIVTCFGLIV